MGAVRSGTLIAFGAWELPQGLEWGLGDKLLSRLQSGLSSHRAREPNPGRH